MRDFPMVLRITGIGLLSLSPFLLIFKNLPLYGMDQKEREKYDLKKVSVCAFIFCATIGAVTFACSLDLDRYAAGYILFLILWVIVFLVLVFNWCRKK